MPNDDRRPRLGLMSEPVDVTTTPEELTLTAEASESMIRGWVESARRRGAREVIAWLQGRGCLNSLSPEDIKAMEKDVGPFT